jgi:anti-sigma28 factor (negative regulator of flagellin synthesis)
MHNGLTSSKATHHTGAAAAPARKTSADENREARVKELRQQYLAGTYKVDAAEISRKLVDSHLRK